MHFSAHSGFQTQGTPKQENKTTTQRLSLRADPSLNRRRRRGAAQSTSCWSLTRTRSITRNAHPRSNSTNTRNLKHHQRTGVSQVHATTVDSLTLANQRLCLLKENDEEEESDVKVWMLLLSTCCPLLPVTQGWRRICSRVGRLHGCWLRHQPISCWHSVEILRLK